MSSLNATSAKEFREYADECMDWARTARSEQERDIFLEMAKTWLEAAIRSEVGQRIGRPPYRDGVIGQTRDIV
jgi:hypothetical protein